MSLLLLDILSENLKSKRSLPASTTALVKDDNFLVEAGIEGSERSAGLLKDYERRRWLPEP
ncbi:MAG: hypothetical protein EOO60_03400 [Hymenobacter sp.]|nr:MAG: hypothetical protein EOO60_03400 [Hymenobacter sp.]